METIRLFFSFNFLFGEIFIYKTVYWRGCENPKSLSVDIDSDNIQISSEHTNTNTNPIQMKKKYKENSLGEVVRILKLLSVGNSLKDYKYSSPS